MASIHNLGCGSSAPEAPAERAPEGKVAALDGELTPFTLTGKVRIGTCGPNNTTLLRTWFNEFLDVKDTHVPAYGLGGTPAYTRNDTSTPEVNDGSYTIQLQRDVAGALVPYTMWDASNNNPTVVLYYQSGTRIVRRAMPAFTAPAPPTPSLQLDFVEDHMASLVVNATADPSDDITTVQVMATSGTGAGIVSARFLSSLQKTGSDPSTVTGFLSTVVNGNQERVTAEVLLIPDTAYTVTTSIVYADGVTSIIESTLTAAQVAACGTVTLDLAAHRAPQTIKGKIWFRSQEAAGVGPRATKYGAFLGQYTDNVPPPNNARVGYIGFTPNGQEMFLPTTGLQAENYEWRGIPAGRYRLDGHFDSDGLSNARSEHGHAILAWPNRPTPTGQPWSRNPPMYRWPYLGGVTPLDLTGPGTAGVDPDGFWYLAAGETEVIDRVIDMAYLDGNVVLAGCLTSADILFGTAEVGGRADGVGVPFADEKGVVRTATTGTISGFARGLFGARTGDYEIAASAGPWVEGVYRLKIRHGAAGDDGYYDGTLAIRPAVDVRGDYLLSAGRAAAFHAPDRVFPTGNLTVHMRVTNADGSSRPFRSPVLAIGADTGNETPFRDPVSGAVLGTYFATSSGPTTAAQDHFVSIIGVTKSAVTIQPSALVPANPDGTGAESTTNFPPIVLGLDGGACGDVCIDSAVSPPTVYHDDGSAPVIHVDPVPELNADTTSVTISGTATDAVPIVALRINGVSMPVTTGATLQPFSRLLSLAGITDATIVATDLCGKSRTVKIPLARCACPSLGSTCQLAACQPDGSCLVTVVGDGLLCEDGDPCTLDVCHQGTCVSTSIVPSGFCDTEDTDECAYGHYACANGQVYCAESQIDQVEECNGLDDDCDGATDEDFGAGQECAVGVGACSVPGHIACIDGTPRCDSIPTAPRIETCNAKDDDCDGQTDVDGANPGRVVCPTPETDITDKPGAYTHVGEATFAFWDPVTPERTNFECHVDSEAWAHCDDGTFTASGLADGDHVFYVRAVGGDGVRDATPASFGWRIERGAPDTEITAGPSDPAQWTTASFTFACHDTSGPCTFECALDRGPFVACGAATTFEGLAEGRRVLHVRATSAAGVTDETPAAWDWLIDLSAPETRIVSGPEVGTTATSAHFTFDDPTDTGTNHFRCSVDGGEWFDCHAGSADADGFALGAHTFQVASVDGVGHVDPTPAKATWTVIPAAPDTHFMSGPSAPTGKSADVAFAFVCPEDVELTTFDCRVDGGAWQECDGGTWTVHGAALAVGEHVAEARACLRGVGVADGDVCDGEPDAWTWTITADVCPGDGAAPVITCAGTQTFECGAGLVVDPAGFVATASDACTPVEVGWDAPASYPVGTSEVGFFAVDANGNRAGCATDVVVRDTGRPTIACPAGLTVDAPDDRCDATVALGAATGDDACAPAALVIGVSGAGADGTLPVGADTVTWVATDPSGNSASCTQAVTVKDVTPPTVSCGVVGEVTQAPFKVVPSWQDVCGATLAVKDLACGDLAVCPATSDASGVTVTELPAAGTVHLTWKVVATDPSGNEAMRACELTVSAAGGGDVADVADVADEDDVGDAEAVEAVETSADSGPTATAETGDAGDTADAADTGVTDTGATATDTGSVTTATRAQGCNCAGGDGDDGLVWTLVAGALVAVRRGRAAQGSSR